MKKTQVLVLAAVLALTISQLTLAQMNKDQEMMGDKGMGMMGGRGMGMMKGDMDKGGMMGGKMMGMMGMGSMMQKQIVATGDGGIIVAVGNKLIKYDKDLNVVKEVELKMDMEGMHKQMMDKGMTGDEHSSHHPENK